MKNNDKAKAAAMAATNTIAQLTLSQCANERNTSYPCGNTATRAYDARSSHCS